MPSNRTTPKPESQALTQVEGLTQIDKINNYLATQPTVEDDPTEPMLEAILQASDPSEWESVFNAYHFKDADKLQLQLNAYRVSPSQFQGKLKYFLILDVTILKTGERTVMTCGSEMAVAQVLNAAGRNRLPIQVEVVRKPTPTKAGFHPMRFRYLAPAAAPLGDPAAVVSEQ